MTGEMVEELILAGADIIKVGIGPGDDSVLHLNRIIYFPSLYFILESQKIIRSPWRDELKQTTNKQCFSCLQITELLFSISSTRFCLYHPQEDRRRVPSAQRCD